MSRTRFHCVGIDYTKYCNACLTKVAGRQMDEVNHLVNQMSIFDEMRMTFEESRALDRMINDAIWEFCFDIHRAMKMGYLFLDPDLDPDWEEKNKKRKEDAVAKGSAAKDSAAKASLIPCPNCLKMDTEVNHIGHSKACFGVKRNQRKAATNFFTEEISYARSTRGKKSQEPKGTTYASAKPAKPAEPAKPAKPPKPAKEAINFDSMTYEEIKAFLDEKCGALTVKKTRCLNSVNCKRHVKERAKVREEYLTRRSDPGRGLESMDQTD